MNFLIILFVLISTLSWADVTGVKRVADLNRNTSPNVLDETYCIDKSDTSGNAAGTDKKCRISDIFKAGDITVDGTNTGVGVTSPTEKFDVLGTVKATAFVGDGSGLTGVAASASDAAYSAAWDGDTTGIASKNALYDKFETIGSGTGGWTDGTNVVYPSVLADNIGVGTSQNISSKLKVIGGGTQTELVDKTWEKIGSPDFSVISGILFSEVNSMGVFRNQLYLGYDTDSSSNKERSVVYKWDGNNLTLHSYLGIGADFEGVSFLQEYKNKLYAGQQSLTPGGGDIWSLDETDTSTPLFFNKIDTQVLVSPSATANQITGSTAFSIEWKGKVFSDGESSGGRILDKTNGTTGTQGYRLFIDSSYRVNFSIGEASTAKTTITSTTVSTGVPLHIVVTWASGAAPKIYINGTEAAYSSSTTVTTPGSDATFNLGIGNRNNATDRTFSGVMNRLRLYRGVELTSGNVTTLYGNGTVSGATAEYLFTEGSGTTITDSSGNGNNGTANEAIWSTGNNWIKVYDDTLDQFSYSATVFNGKLFIGGGYSSPVNVISFDGTTWTNNPITGTGLIAGIYVYKGRLFIGTGNTATTIQSSADGVNWTTEASYTSTSYTEFDHFQEFKGKLYVSTIKGSAGTNDILVRDDATGTWSVLWSTIPGNQVWEMAVYNDVLYFGSSLVTNPATSAVVYKSYDGVTYSADFQPNQLTNRYEYEAFKMKNFNGSLYVGFGGDGTDSATLWRKTDSLGQRFDNVDRVLRNFRLSGTTDDYRISNDRSQLNITIPTGFSSGIVSGVNWQYIAGDITRGNWTSTSPYLNRGAINWTDANLYTGGATGNIGINTGNPGTRLDVQGTVRATAFSGDGSALTGISGSGTVSSGTADRVAIYDTAGTTVTSSSVITDNNTNVGISSTNPGTKLDVTGTVRATAFSGSLTGNASTATALAANPTNCSAGNYPLGIDASGNVESCTSAGGGTGGWSTDSSTKTTTTYNVGIGSVDPTTALDVNGVVKASSLQASSSAAGVLQVFEKASNGTDYVNWSVPDSITTSYGIKWPAAPGTVGQIPMIANSNNDLNWSSLPSSGSSQWTTANTNDVYLPNNGNVAIGTSITTGAALNVMNGNVGVGTFTANALVDISSTAAQDLFKVNDNGTGDATPFIIDSTGNIGIATTTISSLLTIGTTTTNNMTVGTGGNITMLNGSAGTTAINVGGGASLTSGRQMLLSASSNGMTTALAEFNMSGTSGSAPAIKSNYLGVGPAVLIEDSTAPDTTPFVITSAGNVGIGTTAVPTGKFAIAQSADTNSDGIFLLNSAKSGSIRLWVDGSNNMRLDNSSGASNPIFLNGGGGTSAGNIGIGTFSTAALLDVSSKATNDLFMVNDNGSGDTSPFVIKSNGNVGVGSATPGAMLDVSDDIRSVKGGSTGVGACWCTTPPKVLGYCTGALGTCSACNYNGSGC